jgi:transketolase C-terminal domain/subunit
MSTLLAVFGGSETACTGVLVYWSVAETAAIISRSFDLFAVTVLTRPCPNYCSLPGEDGPTHQPVEMLDALRAMPNMHVWRPSDKTETKAAYLSGMRQKHTPTVISLSRQNTPYLAGM